MAAEKLREFALAAGATVDGERIIFADEWQLEHCMSLAVQSTFETLGEMNREQRERAHALLDQWRERFGSRYERLGREDHYAEGEWRYISRESTGGCDAAIFRKPSAKRSRRRCRVSPRAPIMGPD